VPLSRIRDVQRNPDSQPGPAIVVLGYHEFGDDGSHGISEICRAGVRRAEELAARVAPRAVIFTGWSSTGGPSEADQMAAAWAGRDDVELIRETTAANTAENAVRSLEVLRGLDEAPEVIVVCSIRHFPRVHYFFGAPFREHGYAVRYTYVASPLPSARLWRHELWSITRMVRDRRAALGMPHEATSVATAPLGEYG
jgi:uncharacterized SAM-binding protein YcdF (DUF218 family)